MTEPLLDDMLAVARPLSETDRQRVRDYRRRFHRDTSGADAIGTVRELAFDAPSFRGMQAAIHPTGEQTPVDFPQVDLDV